MIRIPDRARLLEALHTWAKRLKIQTLLCFQPETVKNGMKVAWRTRGSTKLIQKNTALQGLYNWKLSVAACQRPPPPPQAHSDSNRSVSDHVVLFWKTAKCWSNSVKPGHDIFWSQSSQCIGSRSLHGQILHTCFRLWFGKGKHSWVILWMWKWTQVLGDFSCHQSREHPMRKARWQKRG